MQRRNRRERHRRPVLAEEPAAASQRRPNVRPHPSRELAAQANDTYRASARDEVSRVLVISNHLKEFVMNQTPQVEVVDLGDAMEQTKGWPNKAAFEFNPILPTKDPVA